MKVIFHEDFLECYTSDPAAVNGRLDPALALAQEHYSLVTPSPCTEEPLLRVHTPTHIAHVRADRSVYPIALLAAGAAIEASRLAMAGEPAFALCRPPGHHASPDSCWGFCYFNNVAVAVKDLLAREVVQKVLIVDFDLHYGDGTANTFANMPAVTYLHLQGRNRQVFLEDLKSSIQDEKADLVAVSAGFDRHIKDWGGLLTTEDYGEIGHILGDFARARCGGRIFTALEGGYNAISLGDAFLAFCRGVEKGLTP
ncbi:MAG: histone deacetylase family protein [Bacillota bacterium]|nr:histone deacetylase family protein [Bacillota bacterium]